MSGVVRVAHVALQLETGGMERLLVEFARCADRRRFDLRFIALGSRGRVAAEIESAGCPVRALDAGPGVRMTLPFRLASLFKRERVDLVHTHNTRPLLYAAPAARLSGAAGLIHTRHGQRRGATPRQTRLFRIVGRSADRIVCVSADSQRLCHREGTGSRSTTVIWNGIDRTRFGLTGPCIGGPALFVGRLAPEKDVATLLRAVARIIEREPAFRLRIAGDGPCRAALAQLADDLHIRPQVEFLGEVADIPGLLSRSSLFVMPSLSEGLPLTVLEAMSRGLPVVATSVGGIPEAAAEGGILIKPGEPASLAAAMLRVWCDGELSRRMGLAGHRRVEQHFDARTMVARYESLYEDVLNGRLAQAA